MAKYIDAEAIESEEMKHYRQKLNSHDSRLFVEFMSWIDDVPPADVIERGKINEAIEEIEKRSFDNEPFIIGECLKTYRDEVVAILKKI